MFRKLSLTALLVAGLPAAAVAGPPWVSIELPANPWDETTRGAFLLVHAFHHGLHYCTFSSFCSERRSFGRGWPGWLEGQFV